MPISKKPEKSIATKSKEENIVANTIAPLVFISHDTRDAELAEEFSNLLKSASAGALKSFRSSDKKGTQGIEYGLDWYPAIMDKIDEASDVVCLLTQRSVDRPWILYEAGVAKGKLGKKVIGIAMGIQHSVAFTGPFAQFQNNDGSIESVTKLVLDLVCSVPGLDPDHNHVGELVKAFHLKATEIVKQSSDSSEINSPPKDENIVAKLFEEVKIMFESLPSRIENRIDPENKKRRRRFHPFMFEEIFHGKPDDSNLSFLIMVSFIKDDFPWIYEIGLETYRNLKIAKSASEKRKLINSFDKSLDILRHPMYREIYGKSEDTHMVINELRNFTNMYFDRFLSEEIHKEKS